MFPSMRYEFKEDELNEIRDLQIARKKEIEEKLEFRCFEFLAMPTCKMDPHDRKEEKNEKIQAEMFNNF